MQHDKQNNKSPLLGIAIVLLFVGAIVAFIVLTKQSTPKMFDEEGQLIQEDSPAVAHPNVEDPLNEYEEDIITPDTIVGTDGRSITDAGYEDGYWAGYEDARLEQKSYDESCKFAASAKDRNLYAANYREGYKEGWACGMQDRESIDQKEEAEKMPHTSTHN